MKHKNNERINRKQRIKKEKIDFINGPINKLMVKLSIPAFMAIIMNLLYGFVDGIFIGRGIGQNALGGVSVVFPLTIIVISFASLVGEGLASVVARGIASKDQSITDSIRTAHGTILWLSLLLIVLSILGMKVIMTLLGATEDIREYATMYYKALLFGLPFIGLSLVYFHQLNAQGEIRIAMQAMIISTVINIVLDYLAIYVLDMGVAGAAYATAISQLIWYGYMHIKAVQSDYIYTVYHPITLAISFKKLTIMMGIGVGSFVRQIGISIALILINSLAGDYGSSIHIAAFGATQRIIRLFIAPIAAINTSLKPIIGQNYGHKAYSRVIEALTIAFKYSLGIGAILFVMMALLKNVLGNAFGIESDQMHVFTSVLLLTIALFPLYGVHHLTVSYFMSIGKGKEAVFINLLKQVIMLIPLVIILPKFLGVYGLFVAIPIADLLSMGIAVLMLRRDIKVHMNPLD